MVHRNYRIITTLLLTLGSVVPGAVGAAPAAGKVIFALGDVTAVAADRSVRTLAKGDVVVSGDTIVTGEDKIQIHFSDGGTAALRAQTEYRIAEYAYSGTADGSERGFFSLLKGGVRFVTSVIGKRDRNYFGIHTQVATIGIRGSGRQVLSCVAGSCAGDADGTYVTTYEGILTILSGAFSGDVLPQETYFCDGATCAKVGEPAPTATISPMIPDIEPVYQQGEQVDVLPTALEPAGHGGHAH